MTLPDNCIRGILNDQFLIPDGGVATSLFLFVSEAREDGWIEQSVNWEDDDKAIAFTLMQTKDDGQLLFRAGAAVLPRSEIDRIITWPRVQNLLSYERRDVSGNKYHDNILLRAEVSKPLATQIAASLAVAVIRQVLPE